MTKKRRATFGSCPKSKKAKLKDAAAARKQRILKLFEQASANRIIAVQTPQQQPQVENHPTNVWFVVRGSSATTTTSTSTSSSINTRTRSSAGKSAAAASASISGYYHTSSTGSVRARLPNPYEPLWPSSSSKPIEEQAPPPHVASGTADTA